MVQEHMLIELFSNLNDKSGGLEIIQETLKDMKAYLGIDALAIRVLTDNDYPYFSTIGFSPSFVQSEKYLCHCDENNTMMYDLNNKPVFECMCGKVMRGRTNPSYAYFTHNGSFWTNDTSELIASSCEKYFHTKTRNLCNKSGYESVALIPIRYGSEIIGLLQLNDFQKNKFSLKLIESLEEACNLIGMSLIRCQSKEYEREQKRMHSIIDTAKAACHEINQPLQILLGNCELLESGIVLQNDNNFQDVLDSIFGSSKRLHGHMAHMQKLIKVLQSNNTIHK